MRMLLAWSVSSSISLVFVSLLCVYVVLSRPVKLVPFTGQTISVSDLSYSPEYLLESARKIAELRLTFNPATIRQQYKDIINITDIKYQLSLKEKLEKEIETVRHKEISSVFYIKQTHANASKNTVVISGELDRTSHGIRFKPEEKTFEVKFKFNGSLYLESFKELSHA